MKAKELIPILQLNPEAEVLVSTVDYYEKILLKEKKESLLTPCKKLFVY